MSFFIHSLFMASFVGLVLHFWRQLPLQEHETRSGQLREFVVWAGKGVAVPLAVWVFINLGLTAWLPPFLPEVDVAKNAGGFWPWTVLRVLSPAMSVIVSWWAALSLIVMTLMIRARTEDRTQFNTTALMWSAVLAPVCAIVLLFGGWTGIGFAVVVWLAPVVHGTLPGLVKVHRAPLYAQAIAKLKFGKYSEAEMEIIKELEQCENDFNGWMMLAELYAVHFDDFEQAERTIVDLCEQPDINPSDACVALHRLADWYLQLRTDPQGARRCMEAISARYPRTHLDRMARLRLRRIPHTAEELAEQAQGRTMHLPALHDEFDETGEAEEVDVESARRRAAALSQTLSSDPNDTHAREEFARALAQLGKLQAAIEQVDLLLDTEGQLSARRAEWMALKAVWWIKLAPEEPELRELLRRIIRDFPHSSQAVGAQRRIFMMEELARVARYGSHKKRPRIVIDLDKAKQPPAN